MTFHAYSAIKRLELELSSLCNAECPLCPRNFYGYPLNRGYTEHNMTLAECQQMFPVEFIQQLDKLVINGNFGDMLMNPEAVNIIEYFRTNNSDLDISISTNAGARTSDFWSALANVNAFVHFCLDGFEDTHSLYRKNTVYSTVLRNAQTFIVAGGKAVWKMIKFDHNLHQIEQARELSKALGFFRFDLVDHGRDTAPVFNKEKKLIYTIGKYKGTTNFDALLTQNSELKTNEISWNNFTKADKIDCEVKHTKSIYVNSIGEAYPCCYIGFNPTTYGDNNSWFFYTNKLLRPIIKNNNVLKVGLEQAIKWFDQVEESWTAPAYGQGQLLTCNYTCGKKCS